MAFARADLPTLPAPTTSSRASDGRYDLLRLCVAVIMPILRAQRER